MTRRRLIGGALALTALEAVWCGLVPAPGERLRLWVDCLSVQGIVIALVGSFLLVDRPFVAARALRGKAPEAARTPARRRTGASLMLGGAALFGAAALIWAVFGRS
ncbi:MAG: hypothetical protein KDA28_02955 [Phycisphaerales bacterium]|nr:hypothetical protein [Phycisphaerales bacterium]MCA9752511.1 hypothetical protein [Gemmatimonadota bacterium]